MIRNVFLIIGIMIMLSTEAETRNFSRAKYNISSFSDYQKIENTQVPINVLRSISAKYQGYVLNEAYLSVGRMFKLTLIKKGKTVVAYYSYTGEFIRHEAK